MLPSPSLVTAIVLILLLARLTFCADVVVGGEVDGEKNTRRRSEAFGAPSARRFEGHFLVDGFPRSKNNMEAYKEKVYTQKQNSLFVSPKSVFFFNPGRSFLSFPFVFIGLVANPNVVFTNSPFKLISVQTGNIGASVLFIDLDDEIMEERLLERAKKYGRSDDNLETIRNRIKAFHKETMPVIDLYREQGKLVFVSTSASCIVSV